MLFILLTGCDNCGVSSKAYTFFLCFKQYNVFNYPCIDTLKSEDTLVLTIVGPIDRNEVPSMRKVSVLAYRPPPLPTLIPESTIVYCDKEINTQQDTVVAFTNLFGNVQAEVCIGNDFLCDWNHITFGKQSFNPGLYTFYLRAIDKDLTIYYDTLVIYSQ